jgi:hypothetical protein
MLTFLMCVFSRQQMTRIESALSAWELDRSCLLGPLTRKAGRPGVAVIDRL